MSKLTDTLHRFEESLDLEATRIQKAIDATKDDIRVSVESFQTFEAAKNIYIEFFQAKLSEYEVVSPEELTEDKKEKFFKALEDSWEGEQPDDAIIKAAMKEVVVTPKFKSDDPREYETDAKGEPNVDDDVPEVVDPKGDPIKEPVVNNEADKANDDAAPDKEKVDDQTDVKTTKPKVNSGEKDTSGDPLK